MSGDPLDEMMGRLAPPVEVAPQRADRVMATVMARLDAPVAQPSRPMPKPWLYRVVLPLSRFALPMAAAAMLGIVVGEGLRPSAELANLDQLFMSTAYTGLQY
jgi:hypothetical protein